MSGPTRSFICDTWKTRCTCDPGGSSNCIEFHTRSYYLNDKGVQRKEIILELRRFYGEREGQLALKWHGGGKGAEGLSEIVFLFLRDRVKVGVGLHWVCCCCCNGGVLCSIQRIMKSSFSKRSRTSPTALPAAQGDAALGTQSTYPPIAQSCFHWRFGRGAICKSILVRSAGERGHSGIRKSIPGNQIAKAKPPTYPKLKIKFPSIGSIGIQLVEPQNKLSFAVGDNSEILCHDSGMRGCWIKCKVLQVSQKRLKVQYDDIQDCDGPEKLEEWIPSYRVACSDKLGMRCTGCITVCPRLLEDSSDFSFEIGAAVDAWWSDGWEEGVVSGFDVCGSGENILLGIQRKNVRASRDWMDDKWVEVKGEKDIKSFISSSITDVSKCSIKEPGNCEKQMAPKLVASEDNKMASTSKHSAEKQDTNVLKLKK